MSEEEQGLLLVRLYWFCQFGAIFCSLLAFVLRRIDERKREYYLVSEDGGPDIKLRLVKVYFNGLKLLDIDDSVNSKSI